MMDVSVIFMCKINIHCLVVFMIDCSILKWGGGKSGKVKFTVGVLQIWLPCTIMPGSMTFLSLKSMSHV